MENNKFTRLILEQNNLKIVWEVPYDDVNGEDMMQAIRTIMIGMTFSDASVESSMADYLMEHSDEYEVTEKDNNECEGYDIETQGLDGGFPSPEEYDNAISTNLIFMHNEIH